MYPIEIMKAGPVKVRRRRRNELPFRMGTIRCDSEREGRGASELMVYILNYLRPW
jgi:hypothetical protein